MSDLKLSDMQEIFKKNSVACDGVVICDVNDWNGIADYIAQIEVDKAELLECVSKFSFMVMPTAGELYTQCDVAKELLQKHKEQQ